MLMLNPVEVKKHEQSLIYFNGFIPMQFGLYINMLKRNNYLKSIGKFEEVQNEIIKVRNAMKASDDADVYEDMVLRKWISDNPQFEDILL